jgi:hypothetical protein
MRTSVVVRAKSARTGEREQRSARVVYSRTARTRYRRFMTTTALPTTLPERAQIEAAGSEAFVWTPAPGVFCGRVVGNVARASIDAYIEAMELVGKEHAWLDVFHDWESVKSYEPDVRARLTSWANERYERMPGSAHVLFGSKLVAMGVTMANAVLRRKMEVYANRVPFDEALRRAATTSIDVRRARLGR